MLSMGWGELALCATTLSRMNTTRRQTLQACLVCLPESVFAQTTPPIETLPFTAEIPDEFSPVVRRQAQQWLARSARTLTAYLGRFPAPQAVVTLNAGSGAGVRSGLTFDGPPPGIRVTVGVDTTREGFLADWIMVHEMMHLAISQLPRRYNWFHEGAATYVEIIARARSGLTSQVFAWDQLMRNLHNGLPLPGETGMDGSQRWGRIYWGGALFFLLADLEIRQRTGNRLGLQDAFAGLVQSGSNYGQRWGLERTLQLADSATGTSALTELYLRMKDDAVATDLPQLFKRLGLQRGETGLQLLAEAPLAGARRAIIAE